MGDDVRRRRAGTERQTERTDEPGDDMTYGIPGLLVLILVILLIVYLIRRV